MQEVESSMENMFIGLKKKKKAKASADDQPSAGADGDDGDDEPSAAVDIPEDQNADGLFEDQQASNMISGDASASAMSLDEGEPWQGTDRDYTYHELLARVFKLIRKANPDIGEKKRYTMIPPQVGRDGKKTIFANLHEMCRRMHRSFDHAIAFLFAELGTQGSVDGSQRLIIKGKFTQKQVETLMRQYIMEYVTCKTCKSPETNMVKENRLMFLKCDACGSSRTVAPIKSGFRAQTEKRRTMRQ